MFQLVYTSTAKAPFDEEALRDLLALSRRKNLAAKVTGMLLYNAGTFLQVLEGTVADVQTTFDRVRRDPRHEHVTIIFTTVVPSREFGDWSMGFVSLNRELLSALSPGYRDVFTSGMGGRGGSGEVAAILQEFRGSALRQYVRS